MNDWRTQSPVGFEKMKEEQSLNVLFATIVIFATKVIFTATVIFTAGKSAVVGHSKGKKHSAVTKCQSFFNPGSLTSSSASNIDPVTTKLQ